MSTPTDADIAGALRRWLREANPAVPYAMAADGFAVAVDRWLAGIEAGRKPNEETAQ